MAIKKGDNVIVRAGKDRGKQAKVLQAMPKEGTLIVEGVNMAKRHEKPRQQGKKGQIVTRATPVKMSAVSLFCAACNKGVRTKVKMVGENKVRVCVHCGAEL